MTEFKNYEEAATHQLAEWVEGRPWHNPLSPCGDRSGECCPDFSCCMPQCLSPEPARHRFAEAVAAGDDMTQHAMLGMFLSGEGTA